MTSLSKNWLEKITPILALTLLTTPFWLSFFMPRLTVYLILIFDLYFVYRGVSLGINATRGYLRIKKSIKTDWLKKAGEENLDYQKVHHVVFIPTYKEPLEILTRTLAFLSQQDFPTKKILVVLAGEIREQGFREKAELLKTQYVAKFLDILITEHTLANDEVAGKSSNQSYASQIVADYIEKNGIDKDFLTFTSCDADVAVHPKYFANLAYLFLRNPHRYLRFWQGALLFYNNIWRVPIPVRVIHTIYSIAGVAELMKPQTAFIYSTYSGSWRLLERTGFWDKDVIAEDWHLFLKAFFASGGHIELESIFLPLSADAVEGRTFRESLTAQYQQSRRWAWGVVDIAYALKQFLQYRKNISLPNFILRFIRVTEQHLLWPVNWWIITLGATLPPLINPELRFTTLGFYLPKLSGVILTISTAFLLLIILIDFLLRPPRPAGLKRTFFLTNILQYLLLPVTGFLFGSLPGMDAHTRLLLGKRLDYKVTEKFDKSK